MCSIQLGLSIVYVFHSFTSIYIQMTYLTTLIKFPILASDKKVRHWLVRNNKWYYLSIFLCESSAISRNVRPSYLSQPKAIQAG